MEPIHHGCEQQWHYETITKNFLIRVRNASCLS